MIKKYLLTIIVLLLIVNISALTVRQNRAVDIRHPIRIDEFPSAGIDCNISVFDPDNEFLVNFAPMTNNYSSHNYTLNPGSTNKIGIYQYDITCTTGLSNKTESFELEVTPTGLTRNIGFYIVILILSGGVILFGFWREDAPIVILGSFGLYFIGLYILFYGLVGVKDTVYTWAIGLIILFLAAYISIRSTHELIVD